MKSRCHDGSSLGVIVFTTDDGNICEEFESWEVFLMMINGVSMKVLD